MKLVIQKGATNNALNYEEMRVLVKIVFGKELNEREIQLHKRIKVLMCEHEWGANYGEIYRHQMCIHCGEERG